MLDLLHDVLDESIGDEAVETKIIKLYFDLLFHVLYNTVLYCIVSTVPSRIVIKKSRY